MSLRKSLVIALALLLALVAGLNAYVVLSRQYSPPLAPRAAGPPPILPTPTKRYDGKEPFELKISGMPGLKMYLDPTDQIITPTILAIGSWERDETYWFLRTVKPGDTIVDVGANAGYYTVIGSKLVGDKGKVYAFEPEPATFELLQKNVRLNGLTNVVLEQKALSNRKGTLKIFIADMNKGDHRIYQPEGESRPTVDVETVRLDEYLKDQKPRVDLIKIDTQGAEGVILEGMKGLLEGRTDGPTIFMEFWPHGLHGMGTDAGDLLKTLQSYKYKLFDMTPQDGKRLRLVEPADLLAAHPVDSFASQTDLMLLRGGRAPPKE